MITEKLQKEGVPAIPVQASAMTLMSKIKVKYMYTEVIRELLKIGMVPVLYGVPAIDIRMKCSILSGDQIISWLGKDLKPDMIIHGTDVDGIFSGDPKNNKKARVIREIRSRDWPRIKKMISGSSSVDVTGGMLLKVSEMIALAEMDIPSFFINAKKPGNVEKALRGKEVRGTVIKN